MNLQWGREGGGYVIVIHNLEALPQGSAATGELGLEAAPDSPSVRERYFRNSSRKMTGIEKHNTANHSVKLRGVILNTLCCNGETVPRSVHYP